MVDSIQKPLLTEIKELKVEKLMMSQHMLDLSFGFKFQGQTVKIGRQFNFSDNVVTFIITLMNDIKKASNMKIEKEEEMKEKLVNYMSRLLQSVKDLDKYKEYSRYMREFNKINCYKVNFPEVEMNPAKRASERWA